MSADPKSALLSPRGRRHRANRGPARRNPREFWIVESKGPLAGAKARQRVFRELVRRVISSSGVELFDAVEAGVPTYLVDVIAGAIRKLFFHDPGKRRRVGARITLIFVVNIRVRVDMENGQFGVVATHGAHDGMRDGVVTAQTDQGIA
jgi:hypothetical protein